MGCVVSNVSVHPWNINGSRSRQCLLISLLTNSPGQGTPQGEHHSYRKVSFQLQEQQSFIQKIFQTYDDNEADTTPSDDDCVVDDVKYYQDNVGLFTKVLDFRTRFVDEKRVVKRPQITAGKLYEDTEFPRQANSRYNKKYGKVEWKRPKEFLDKPKLFINGASMSDVKQGSAGNCWFLSTLATIANDKKLIEQVIPQDAYRIENPSKYDGVFHARFYKFGKWEDIYIDDILPVIYENKLWGAESPAKNELWVSLLEKALAKKYGSYDAIYGGGDQGHLMDAYLQLTGGISEMVEQKDKNQGADADTLFDLIKNALGHGKQITCSVDKKHDKIQGLVGNHTYSLIGVFEDKASKAKLIKLRNPWGKMEWTGAWSDGSPEWAAIRNKQSMIAQTEEKIGGEFNVSIKDFMKYFSNIKICSRTPDFDCDGVLHPLGYLLNIYGEWNGKTAAGFDNLLQNPRFCFTVTKSGLVNNEYIPFVVQVMQEMKAGETKQFSVRCDIFKVLADRIQSQCRHIALKILGSNNNCYKNDLAIFRHKLKPGRYIVVASTLNKGQEKAFLLRLFTPAPLENIKEIPIEADVMSCENEETIQLKTQTQTLAFEKVLFGKFIKGHNAGGQVSNRSSYHKNPQYLITIPDTGKDVPLVINIMQSQKGDKLAVGIRIFKLDNTVRPPLDINYLYDHYDSSPADIEGSQDKFVTSWSVKGKYLLKAGEYVALIFLNKPSEETSYYILFKSTVHVDIKGYQTR